MRKILLIALTLVLVIGCAQKNDKDEAVTVKDSIGDAKFQMYEMSEMAALMEQMYAYNMQLKERITSKENLGDYPIAFDKLHTAVLTEASDRDAFFNDQAMAFITAQKAIYADTLHTKDNFNKMVKQCLECHAKKCGGPIPRIKKLFIP